MSFIELFQNITGFYRSFIYLLSEKISFFRNALSCVRIVFFWRIFAVLTLEAEILSHLLMFWNVTIIVQFLSFLSNLSHFGNNTLQSVGNKRFSMCFSKCLIVGACMQIYFFWNTLSCVRIVFFGAYLRFWL